MCLTCNKKQYVIVTSVICALMMAFVDGVLQPSYFIKSVAKICVFLLPALGCYMHFRAWEELKGLFKLKKWELLIALGLGIGALIVIIGGYFLIDKVYDLDAIILARTSEGGVSAENFLYVSTYIALVNSMLEEFFFRGYAFLNLKKLTSRRFAYVFSAALFAIYHFGMLGAGATIMVSLVALVLLFISGVILNALNEHSGSILTSWLLHMCANLAINTVGFYVFGMI